LVILGLAPKQLEAIVMNRLAKLCLVTGLLLPLAVSAHEPSASPLFQVNLDDLGNREGLMAVVDFLPGVKGVRHRHNAHTFVYVLEGSVVMQVEGGERKVLHAGQTFYETPDDIHVVGDNASATAPAKILVFLAKERGAPPTIPVP